MTGRQRQLRRPKCTDLIFQRFLTFCPPLDAGITSRILPRVIPIVGTADERTLMQTARRMPLQNAPRKEVECGALLLSGLAISVLRSSRSFISSYLTD